MKYCENNNYLLINDKMQNMFDYIEKESVDAIITDPPYELNFMNKGWDNAGVSFQVDTWKKCFEALKSGGYLLAFGGTRTYHRIACAIEDAGFEIRDCVMWLYGCYSSDTQVLTNKGWKYFYELDKTEKILQWDKDTNILSWIKPLNYFEYDIDDEMVLLENRHTSQLLSKNHKVIAKIQKNERKQVNGVRKIISKRNNYEIIEAQNLKNSWSISLPMASNLDGEIDCKYAYMLGWWLTDAYKHKDGKACMFTQSKHKTLQKLKAELDRLKELGECNYSEYIEDDGNINHKPEHIFYVTGKLADYLLTNYNNREMTWDLLNFNLTSKKELWQGLMDGDGSVRKGSYSKTFWTKKQIRKDIMSALLTTMNYRNYIVEDGVVFNTEHNSTEISYKHRKPMQKYKGKIYCLETETGAFVVRRNGKPFISGNSGFPKSMNIGLAVDKKNGIDNRTGKNEFAGYGTCLKPAYEPIIIARKPFNGSLVDNVLKYGVGGLNIDECRVGNEQRFNPKATIGKIGIYNWNNITKENDNYNGTIVNGRFPANVILTYDDTDFDEVCGGMSYTKSETNFISNKGSFWGTGNNSFRLRGFDDEDSASRYFYCAKASAKDRDEGLDEFEIKMVAGIAGADNDKDVLDDVSNRFRTAKRNFHVCVKPTELMQYLIRLVCPKGSTILDPFMGSGSTGKACMFENRERNANYKFIGIEMTDEYLPLAQARIDYALNKFEYDKEQEDKENKENGKLTIFDFIEE